MKHQPFRHALQLCTLLYLSVTSVLAGEWEILFDGSGTEALRGYQMSSFPSKGWDLGDDATLRSNPDGQVIDIITKKKYQHFVVFRTKINAITKKNSQIRCFDHAFDVLSAQ